MKMLDAAAIDYAKSQKLNRSNATIERALSEAFKAGYEYRKRLSLAEAYTPPDVLPKTVDPLRTSVDSWRKR